MTIVLAILLFSILIFVHELGHFLVAKASGVQVNEFSLFMGPAIFKKQVGETLYAIRCIPIGGYCAMEGEDEDSDNPRAFGRAKWWKRFLILAAGAFMNFVAGLVLYAIVFGPAQQFVVPEVTQIESGSALAENNGLQAGDYILAIDGERLYVQSDFNMILTVKGGETHSFTVRRNGEKITLPEVSTELRAFDDGNGGTSMRYGLTFGMKQATFGDRVAYVWNTAMDSVRTVRLSLQMLLSGQAGFKDLSGPVGIVDQINTVAQESETKQEAMLNIRYFMGFIAINLAVMNMLPLPALDGGRIFLLLVNTGFTAITKKKIPAKFEGYIHAAGMVILLAFMAFVTFKDIWKLFQ